MENSLFPNTFENLEDSIHLMLRRTQTFLQSRDRMTETPPRGSSEESDASRAELAEELSDTSEVLRVRTSSSATVTSSSSTSMEDSDSTIEYDVEFSGISRNAGPPAYEVVSLDDTRDDNEVQFVQSYSNPNPPIIDLCTSAEDHSYSRGIRRQRNRQGGPPTRIQRRRNDMVVSRAVSYDEDHSYAHNEPSAAVVQVSAPPSQLDESATNSSLRLTCSICLDSYVKRQPHSTNCGHIFCKSCIQEAIKANKQCPLCRKKLGPKMIHPIHL